MERILLAHRKNGIRLQRNTIFDSELKLSELTYIYPNYGGAEKNLIVSNTSGASVIVEDEIVTMLQKFKEPAIPSEFLDQGQEHIILDFHRAEILIDADISGFNILNEKIEQLKNRSELDLIPTVTKECNLACPYCFEGTYGKKKYMDRRLVTKIVDYTMKRIENEGITMVFASLYGGEPLLNKKACRLFLESMKKETDRLNVNFKPSLITNGTLIDKTFLKFMGNFDVFYVQVTLDGPREIHDQRRIYKNGAGSYDVIIRNLLLVPEYARLQIRINVDLTNFAGIPELIDDLISRGLNKKNVRVDFARIMGNTSSSRDYKNRCIDPEYFDLKVLPYIKIMQDAGFDMLVHPTNKPRYIYCAAYSGKHIVIDPDGNLFACLEGIGNPEYVVGNIWNDPMYNSHYDEWNSVSTLNYEKCRKCDVIGFCGGGCGAEAIGMYGSLTKERACPSVKWSYIGGVVLPAQLRDQLEERK